jgi:hypothetical protein
MQARACETCIPEVLLNMQEEEGYPVYLHQCTSRRKPLPAKIVFHWMIKYDARQVIGRSSHALEAMSVIWVDLGSNRRLSATTRCSRSTGVANPTPRKMNLMVKCQTSRESGFARALTVRHPSRRSEALRRNLQGIRLAE